MTERVPGSLRSLRGLPHGMTPDARNLLDRPQMLTDPPSIAGVNAKRLMPIVDGQDDYAPAAAAFATGLAFFAAAFLTAAHRLRVASMIALRPAALSLRFFGATLLPCD